MECGGASSVGWLGNSGNLNPMPGLSTTSLRWSIIQSSPREQHNQNGKIQIDFDSNYCCFTTNYDFGQINHIEPLFPV